ncbi:MULTISPECIES: GNAT family N-acetyltransferase [Streptomyces]|uniref:GNAT family N-acetyltransferase n=1 Tax=Streptomyces TaxID=1883 RepID=UPI00069A279E|nr:GNAT family N-acetyltransferase [Streptomyces sp. SID7805]MYU55059.1 GNAT family N-acetyltransferase [Streptomyces sp. SID7805]
MISIRELTMDDAPAVQRIYSGASVRFTRQLDQAGATAWIAEALAAAHAVPRDRWCFGITVTDDLIGVIKIRCRTRKYATVSYILREDSWGRGYATHAVAEVLRFAFTTAGLDAVGARHHPDNPASGRVLLKNGFDYRGNTPNGYALYEIHKPFGGGS